MINFSNMKSLLGRIWVVICLTLMLNGRSHGYVMPAEQMLDFMAKNFSNFKTVDIVQSTMEIGQDSEKVFMEQIRLKSPDLFELKSLDRMTGRTDIPYMAYRQLLMANSRARLEQILYMMGINLQAVSLTRIDGIIAYRIGEKGDDIPKLLIEKERFLPLLLIYRTTGDMSKEIVTVRFQDYRKEDKGWFPFQINYSVGNKIREEYNIQTLQTNIPISSSLLQTFEITRSTGQ
jgi:hypothetical protein